MSNNAVGLALAMNLPSITSICWAGHLAVNQAPTWGWFLLVSVLLAIPAVGTVNLVLQKKE